MRQVIISHGDVHEWFDHAGIAPHCLYDETEQDEAMGDNHQDVDQLEAGAEDDPRTHN